VVGAHAKGSKQKLIHPGPPKRRSTSHVDSRPRSSCSQASTSPSPRPPILTTTPHKSSFSSHPLLDAPRPLTCDQDLDIRYSRTSRIVSRRPLLLIKPPRSYSVLAPWMIQTNFNDLDLRDLHDRLNVYETRRNAIHNTLDHLDNPLRHYNATLTTLERSKLLEDLNIRTYSEHHLFLLGPPGSATLLFYTLWPAYELSRSYAVSYNAINRHGRRYTSTCFRLLNTSDYHTRHHLQNTSRRIIHSPPHTKANKRNR
jgi:hypothetical protein